MRAGHVRAPGMSAAGSMSLLPGCLQVRLRRRAAHCSTHPRLKAVGFGHCVHSQIPDVFSGVYNEEIWESLDFVLAEAAKRDLRLIIPIEVTPCFAVSAGGAGACCDCKLQARSLLFVQL